VSRAGGSTSESYDAIVVGGGLGGMLVACVLGRAGLAVLLLEKEPALGGRLRSFDVAGGYVVDAGAYLWPDAHFSTALARAGVTDFATSEIPRSQVLRLYAEGGAGRRLAFPFPLRQATPKMLESAALSLAAGERVYADLCALWRRLADCGDAEVEELRSTSLGEALPLLGVDREVGRAFRRNVMMYGTYDPDRASMAECIELCRPPRDRTPAAPVVAGANPEGGVRALVRSLARGMAAARVEVRLGGAVEGIDAEGVAEGVASGAGRVTGVRLSRAGGAASTVRARTVVCNIPIDRALAVLPAGRFSAPFVGAARRWSVIGGVIACAYAFRRLPTLRETGVADAFPGWTRLLTGSERGFGGGMLWTTLHSPANAPAGHHILQAMRLSPRADVEDVATVAGVHAAFDRMLDEIYLDADELLAWSRRWTTADGTEYMISTAQRPPVSAPGVAGLYFVGETTDVPAVQMDAAALSAMRCCDLVLGRC